MEKYGTEAEDGSLRPHITVFQPIVQVNADLIQRIMTILHGTLALHLIARNLSEP